MLADRMTCNDKMVSIFRHGINNDNIGPIAKASFEETPEQFLKAAKHGELDIMKGVSANIMCGQEGFYGTSSFKVLVDMDYVLSLTPDKEEQEQEEEVLNIEKEFYNEDENSNCSTNNLLIESAVSNIRPQDMGNSDDYNMDF